MEELGAGQSGWRIRERRQYGYIARAGKEWIDMGQSLTKSGVCVGDGVEGVVFLAFNKPVSKAGRDTVVVDTQWNGRAYERWSTLHGAFLCIPHIVPIYAYHIKRPNLIVGLSNLTQPNTPCPRSVCHAAQATYGF